MASQVQPSSSSSAACATLSRSLAPTRYIHRLHSMMSWMKPSMDAGVWLAGAFMARHLAWIAALRWPSTAPRCSSMVRLHQAKSSWYARSSWGVPSAAWAARRRSTGIVQSRIKGTHAHRHDSDCAHLDFPRQNQRFGAEGASVPPENKSNNKNTF